MANELPLANANAIANALAGNNSSITSLYGSEHLNRVRGIEGMDSFQTKASSEHVLFEENNDVMCIKVTDASNNSTDRYFSFKEITRQEAMQLISPYVMKDELDSFKNDIIDSFKTEIASFKEEILNAQQPVRKQNESNLLLSTNNGR